ncbi:MAG: TolC family protein [Acidobacteria bacterium]|nr:TolC family protein [Acidobacteriota bacterium]
MRIPVAALLLCASAGAQTQALTYQQVVQEAIQNNLDLAAERVRVSVAEAREITARLRPNPVLTVSGQTLDVLGANYSPDTPLGPNQLNIHTDFPFERGHKREERIAVAKEEKSIAELGVREVMRQVIASVQSAFVDILRAKENLKLAEENLTSLTNVVAINESRLRAGDLAQVELDRSRVAAMQYRAAVVQAQLELDQARTQLQQVMGRKQKSTEFDISGELQKDVLMDGQDELLKKALARRPDYLLGQESQARSRADLRLQMANGKVDYTVGTEYTHQRAWGISGSSMGVYFSMPLPVFNRNQGEIARAEREIVLAGARNTALESSIQAEVIKAYRQYEVNRQLLASIEAEMISKARSVRETTEYSYKRGEASLVEYLDAQRAFNDTMVAFNDARANYARSLYLLDTVTAGTVAGQ